MQVMLAAFLQMNTKNTGIQSVQADQIGRTYPPLFTLNLPKEEEIIDDLREITAMEYVVQVIMMIVYIAVIIIVMYFCCTKCRHTRTIFKYCFLFLPISYIIRTSQCTDLFVEVSQRTLICKQHLITPLLLILILLTVSLLQSKSPTHH